MRFGIREAVDVVFKAAAANTKIGGETYDYHEPVFYFDTLKASTTEGTSTTVYAQGGKGNPRLIAWEGDKAITFNFTDALISAQSLAMLTGSDLYEADEDRSVTLHRKNILRDALITKNNTKFGGTGSVVSVAGNTLSEEGEATTDMTFTISLKDLLVAPTNHKNKEGKDLYHASDLAKELAYAYIVDPVTDEMVLSLGQGKPNTTEEFPAGTFTEDTEGSASISKWNPTLTFTIPQNDVKAFIEKVQALLVSAGDTSATDEKGAATITDTTHLNILIDYYTTVNEGVKEIYIRPDKFAGYFYIEGDTLFRRERDGVDLPAQLTIPHAKVQTAFTLTMSPEGDPSTFDFAVDAFPGKVAGNRSKKILYALQIIEDEDLIDRDIYDYDTSN